MTFYKRRWYGGRSYVWLKLASFLVIVVALAIGLYMLTDWIWPA